MSLRLSRRQIADYFAKQIIDGAKLSEISNQLAAFLIDTRRTRELSLIIRDIESYLANSGVVIADVTTVEAIDDEIYQSVESVVKRFYSVSKLHIRQHRDASILGGLRIKLPDGEFDSTLKHKLTHLNTIKL